MASPTSTTVSRQIFDAKTTSADQTPQRANNAGKQSAGQKSTRQSSLAATGPGAGTPIRSPPTSQVKFGSTNSKSTTSHQDGQSSSFLPDFWSDDKRMRVLFDEFRPRESNPENWDSKMKFWQQAISHWSQASGKAVFDLDTFRQAYKRNFIATSSGDQGTTDGTARLPHENTIRLVASQMLRAGPQLVPYEQIEAELRDKLVGNGWLRWGVSTLTAPVRWGVSSAVSYLLSDTHNETILPGFEGKSGLKTALVQRDALNQVAEKVLTEINHTIRENTGLCVTLEQVTQSGTFTKTLDEKTLDLVLLLLQADNQLGVTQDGDQTILKTGTHLRVFSEKDLGLVRLERGKRLLDEAILKLEDELESLRQQAKVTLADGNRTRALGILRKKKRLEGLLERRETQRDNLELLQEQLSEAESQRAVLLAYQQATKAMRNFQANLDEVEQVMAEAEAVTDQAADLIAEASRPLIIAPDLTGGISSSRKELDRELADLLGGDSEKEVKVQPEAKEETDKNEFDKDDERELLEMLDQLEVVQDDLSPAREAKVAVKVPTTDL